jgi:hypothetical protein
MITGLPQIGMLEAFSSAMTNGESMSGSITIRRVASIAQKMADTRFTIMEKILRPMMFISVSMDGTILVITSIGNRGRE